jgi:mono/diheme cytochrome c family protein
VNEESNVVRYFAFLPVVALFVAVPVLRQDSPPPAAQSATFSVPPDIAAKTNPVHPTPAGLAQARKMYGYDCSMCHGKEGDGKGDMAADMKTPMKNWQDPSSLKAMSDGELFYIIDKGKGEMTGEGDRAKPEQIWNMVSVVREFAKK